MGQLFSSDEGLAIMDKLMPSMTWNVRRWRMLLQPGNSLDPLAGNELLLTD